MEMSEWKEYKLGELSDVKGGKRLPKGELLVDYETPHPYIRVTDLGNKWIKKEGLQFVTPKIQRAISRYIVNTGDVIVSIVGSIGFVGRVSNELDGANLTENCVKFVVKPNALDNDFFYYFLSSKIGQDEIEKRTVGSTQPKLPLYNIKDIEILLPSFHEQKSIAEILSSLDAKIDLLQRQNKTLEQMAETLFRQWFVEEAASWRSSILDDWILFDPREKMDKKKMYQMFEMKCLSNTDMSIGEGIIREVSSSTIFRNEDTLLAKITPCLENGKTGFVMHLGDNEIARGSTEFIVMRTKGQVSPYWIYCLARYKDFHDSAVLSMTGTSGRQRVQVDLLKSYEVKVDIERMKEFHSLVAPLFQKVKSSILQIRTLTKLRDTLLPKLMSGEVSSIN
jgi:type I restriction enzyme, S subunit